VAARAHIPDVLGLGPNAAAPPGCCALIALRPRWPHRRRVEVVTDPSLRKAAARICRSQASPLRRCLSGPRLCRRQSRVICRPLVFARSAAANQNSQEGLYGEAGHRARGSPLSVDDRWGPGKSAALVKNVAGDRCGLVATGRGSCATNERGGDGYRGVSEMNWALGIAKAVKRYFRGLSGLERFV